MRGIRVPRRRYLVVAGLAVLAVLGGLLGPWLVQALTDTTAKDRIAADPPPALFGADDVRRIDPLTRPQASRAHDLMAAWWADHGTDPDDEAFMAWLEDTFPGPPDAKARAREMNEVEALARARTDAGVVAATWLEEFGKKDVWKLEVHDQAEWEPEPEGEARKDNVDVMLSMSKDVADALGARFEQSAPYVIEPALRTDHVVEDGQVCPCSYPSRHASAAAASRTYLAHFSPQRDRDYRWFEDQIDYSRIYMAGHVASDISAGALLGDMIGEYFLVTRDHVHP